MTTVTTSTDTGITTIGYDYISYLKAAGQDFCTSYISYIPPTSTRFAFLRQTYTLTTTEVTQVTNPTLSTTFSTSVTATTTVLPPIWPRALKIVERQQIDPVETPVSVRDRSPAELSSFCLSVATTTVFTSRVTYLKQAVTVYLLINSRRSFNRRLSLRL